MQIFFALMVVAVSVALVWEYAGGNAILLFLAAWGLHLLAVSAVLALAPAAVAAQKGRSFGVWYVYGFFLWIVALVHALVIRDARDSANR